MSGSESAGVGSSSTWLGSLLADSDQTVAHAVVARVEKEGGAVAAGIGACASVPLALAAAAPP